MWQKIQKLNYFIAGLLIGLGIFSSLISFFFLNKYQDKFFPNTYIDDYEVSQLTIGEAKNLLTNKTQVEGEYQIILENNNISLASSSAQLGLRKNYEAAITEAVAFKQQQPFFKKLLLAWKIPNKKLIFKSHYEFNKEKATEFLDNYANLINEDWHLPSAKLKYSNSPNSLIIDSGKIGQELDLLASLNQLQGAATNSDLKISPTITTKGRKLDTEEIANAQKRAQKFIGKELKLIKDEKVTRLTDQELIELLTFPDGISEVELEKKLDKLAQEVNQAPQDAEFIFNPQTLVVEKFSPSLPGLTIDRESTKEQLAEFVKNLDLKEQDQNYFQQELLVKIQEPVIPLAKTNNLGINELIGLGDSFYAHSIPNRIYNVALTAKKINNTIIKPGEEFRFNSALGEVSAKTGYKSAYVIQGNETILANGGGVCQVSTTVFRAALDAGLKITKRYPHSYRVSYYELNSKPGVDATVYAGDIDLRFINNTPGYILLHTETDSKNLYMKVSLYGTDDGRYTKIINHKTWDYRPPLATQYIPTPELPAGVKKQIDWAVAGIKAEFTHQIFDKNNNLIEENTYYSNYRPWAAKYLVGS